MLQYIHAHHYYILMPVNINIQQPENISGKDELEAAAIASGREGDDSASTVGEECVQGMSVDYIMVRCI